MGTINDKNTEPNKEAIDIGGTKEIKGLRKPTRKRGSAGSGVDRESYLEKGMEKPREILR